MSTLNASSKPESARLGGQIQSAYRAGILTDAMVNANTTLTLLKAAITAASNFNNVTIAQRTNLALNRAKSLGLLTETHGLTTIAGITALLDAPSTTFYQQYND